MLTGQSSKCPKRSTSNIYDGSLRSSAMVRPSGPLQDVLRSLATGSAGIRPTEMNFCSSGPKIFKVSSVRCEGSILRSFSRIGKTPCMLCPGRCRTTASRTDPLRALMLRRKPVRARSRSTLLWQCRKRAFRRSSKCFMSPTICLQPSGFLRQELFGLSSVDCYPAGG